MNALVNQQQALSLKELRFDKPTNGYYHIRDNEAEYAESVTLTNHNEFNNEVISCPTLYDVFQWLYEKYGICVSVVPELYSDTDDKLYGFRVYMGQIKTVDTIRRYLPLQKLYEFKSYCLNNIYNEPLLALSDAVSCVLEVLTYNNTTEQ